MQFAEKFNSAPILVRQPENIAIWAGDEFK